MTCVWRHPAGLLRIECGRVHERESSQTVIRDRAGRSADVASLLWTHEHDLHVGKKTGGSGVRHVCPCPEPSVVIRRRGS